MACAGALEVSLFILQLTEAYRLVGQPSCCVTLSLQYNIFKTAFYLALAPHSIQVALSRGAQLVVLGSASEPHVQQHFEALAADYANGGDARLVLRYDEGLAHR